MLLKSPRCAVADQRYTYYYQFLEPGNQYSPGVYQTQYPNGLLYACGHRVWRQGARGGVRIISEEWDLATRFGHGYKTTDPEIMKEFAWIKLRAKPYEH